MGYFAGGLSWHIIKVANKLNTLHINQFLAGKLIVSHGYRIFQTGDINNNKTVFKDGITKFISILVSKSSKGLLYFFGINLGKAGGIYKSNQQDNKHSFHFFFSSNRGKIKLSGFAN